MFVRIPVRDQQTGERALFVMEIEDRSTDPLSSIDSAGVVPALLACGLGLGDLARLNGYRSAVLHGFYTDQLRAGEAEHIGPIEMPGNVDPLYGLTEHERGYVLWLHADRATGRIGGPNDGA